MDVRASFFLDVAWSPDGTRLAFSACERRTEQRPAVTCSVHVVDTDGSDGRRIADDANWVSWSPGAERLVYASRADGDIYVANARTGQIERRLTEWEGEDSQPAWSPQGNLLAFVSRRSGSRDIWVLDLRTAELRQVTNADGDDWNPQWSADGSSLVFYRSTGDHLDQIYSVQVDGTAEIRLTDGADNNFYPSFAPGEGILFARQLDETSAGLFLLDGDARSILPIEGAASGFARFSPDGRRLALIVDLDSRQEIRVRSADGRQTVIVTATP
jgi:TolB protein